MLFKASFQSIDCVKLVRCVSISRRTTVSIQKVYISYLYSLFLGFIISPDGDRLFPSYDIVVLQHPFSSLSWGQSPSPPGLFSPASIIAWVEQCCYCLLLHSSPRNESVESNNPCLLYHWWGPEIEPCGTMKRTSPSMLVSGPLARRWSWAGQHTDNRQRPRCRPRTYHGGVRCQHLVLCKWAAMLRPVLLSGAVAVDTHHLDLNSTTSSSVAFSGRTMQVATDVTSIIVAGPNGSQIVPPLDVFLLFFNHVKPLCSLLIKDGTVVYQDHPDQTQLANHYNLISVWCFKKKNTNPFYMRSINRFCRLNRSGFDWRDNMDLELLSTEPSTTPK